MPSLLKSAAAGLIGGLVAAAAMDLFQRVAAPLAGGGGDDDPATVKAANTATRAVTGEAVADEAKGAAGELVHYLAGAGFGLVYGVLAPRLPAITSGFGSAYATALAGMVDNGVVPLAGWGPPPSQTTATTQAYGGTSHMVYGTVLEGTRRVVAGLLD